MTRSRTGGYPLYEAQEANGLAETPLFVGQVGQAAVTIARALDAALAGHYQGLTDQASAVRDRITARRADVTEVGIG